MKRCMVQIVIGIGVAVMAGSCAEQATVLTPMPREPMMTGKTEVPPALGDFEGTISRIDAEKELVTVEHWPLSKTFQVPPGCLIDVLTNANAVLAELRVGDAVVVTYSEVGKDLVASRIVREGKAYDEERQEKMERLDEMLNPSPNQ
jgi:hypothetical protein